MNKSGKREVGSGKWVKQMILYCCVLTTPYFLLATHCLFATGFPSLQIIGDARSRSMAESLVAVDGALYFNPANTAFLENKEISFTHTFWFEDIKLDNITYVYPTLEQGVFGVGLTYLYTVVEERNTDTETPVGEFKFNDGFLVFSYAKRVIKNFSIGSNLKIIRETIDNVRGRGFAIDLGSLYHFTTLPLSFGFAVQNIGPKIKFIEAEEKLPLSINFGTSWEIKKR